MSTDGFIQFPSDASNTGKKRRTLVDTVSGESVHSDVTVIASGTNTAIVTAAGALTVDASATTQPVSGTFWQATQPVSVSTGTNTATVTAAGALKVDASATTQPVSGTFWQATQPVSVSTGTNTATVTAAGALKVDASAVTQPVSGTFWQATQPVSGTVGIGTSNTYIGNVKLFDGTNTGIFNADGSLVVTGAKTRPKVLGVSGSLSVLVNATWCEKVVWAVPASYIYKPKVAHANVTTAATRTLICAGQKLATWNENTNAFTDSGTSIAAPDFYDRIFARVTTTHANTANTITVTHTDQDGASSSATIAMPATSLAAGNWVEGTFAAGDYGMQDITAVSDSAAPATGVIEIWGLRTLAEYLGPANNTEAIQLGEGIGIPNGETIVILFNAAATTAQVRSAHLLGDLVPA